jgi:hypothetical protein
LSTQLLQNKQTEDVTELMKNADQETLREKDLSIAIQMVNFGQD